MLILLLHKLNIRNLPFQSYKNLDAGLNQNNKLYSKIWASLYLQCVHVLEIRLNNLCVNFQLGGDLQTLNNECSSMGDVAINHIDSVQVTLQREEIHCKELGTTLNDAVNVILKEKQKMAEVIVNYIVTSLNCFPTNYSRY